jgi:hypothetical protein
MADLPKKKIGGARPGAGRKDPRNGVRRNYQYDFIVVDMLNNLFLVPHAKRRLRDGLSLTRSKFINAAVLAACEYELEMSNKPVIPPG